MMETGCLNTGAKYNPQSDTWTEITAVDAPSARMLHSAVWTGTEMIIWGGRNDSIYGFNNGGRYNPETDSWIGRAGTENPPVRHDDFAVKNDA